MIELQYTIYAIDIFKYSNKRLPATMSIMVIANTYLNSAFLYKC